MEESTLNMLARALKTGSQKFLFLGIALLLVSVGVSKAQTPTILNDQIIYKSICTATTIKNGSSTCTTLQQTPYVKYQEATIEAKPESTEITDLRTSNSQTFKISDTEYQLKLYSGDNFGGIDNKYYLTTKVVPQTEFEEMISAPVQEPLGLFDFFKSAFAATTSASIINDTNLFSDASTTNYNTTGYAYVGRWTNYMPYLLTFTLPDLSGKTVGTSTLYLQRINSEGQAVNTGVAWVWASRDVDATTATYNNYKTGSAWTTPGGDISGLYDVKLIAASNGSYNWNISSSSRMVSNATIGLIVNNQGTPNNYWVAATNEHATTGYRPYLILDYTITPTSTPTSTPSTSTTTALTSSLDDDTISAFMLYWFYVILAFILLTLGYWLVDTFIHKISGKK